jgi:hypothetical protein
VVINNKMDEEMDESNQLNKNVVTAVENIKQFLSK